MPCRLPVALLPEGPRRGALTALDQLPDRIGLLDFRTVVPTMAALNVGRQLNLLAAEALAAALLLDADVLVATDAPLIRQGAARLGLTYRITAT